MKWKWGTASRQKKICAKFFINRLHLVLYACVQTFDVMFLGKIFETKHGLKEILRKFGSSNKLRFVRISRANNNGNIIFFL